MKLHHAYSKLAPALLAMTFAASAVYAQDAADRSTTLQTQARSDTQVTPAKRAALPNQGQAASGVMLNDGQVLQIVRTLNDGEIKQANEAIDQSESADVKQLAEMIKLEHEQANEQVDELLDGELNLDGSDLNSTLEKNAEDTHERLQDLSGAEYDCAYLQAQVAQHEAAIETSKTVLMPNAKEAGVQAFLTAMGPKLEHHLEMAQASLGKVSCQ